MNTVHTETYRGLTIQITQDEYADSPDQWGNDDVFLIYDHRNFCVGRKGFDGQEIYDHLSAGHKTYNGYWVLPLYAYIHSGVSLSLGRASYPFTCPWDTSMKGFVLVKRQKGWSYTQPKARKIAQSLVDEWNDYLSGNVYAFTVTDENGDVLDSCAGFYGDYEEGALPEARATADYHAKQTLQKRLETVKTWIRNNVPLTHRVLPAIQ